MSSLRGTAVKLAIFTIFTIAITTWLASIIGNFRLFSQPYEISAEFTDASGLLKGDVVKAAGVTVGRVSSVGVDDGLAVVSMQIDEGVELPASLSAAIRFRNLVGQRMVLLETDPDLDLEGLVRDGENIPVDRTEPAFDLTLLFNGLRPIIQTTSPGDINIVSRSLVKALEGRGDDIEAFLANLSNLADEVTASEGNLTTVLDNVNVLTADLGGRDAQLRRTLSNIDDFLTDLSESKIDLDEALTTLDVASTRLGRLVETNDANIEASLDDLAALLDAINDRRGDLRSALRSLPEMLTAVERVNSYGQWSMVHLIDACKDDLGTCGTRGSP